MTLAELYELFDELRPFRRRAAATILDRQLDDPGPDCRSMDVCCEAAERIERAYRVLCSLPGDGVHRELTVDGRELPMTLDYEFAETERDLACLRQGREALEKSLHVPGSFRTELAELTGFLGSNRYAAVFSDRDGTIANYCGRYRSSHQPLYAAVRIARFARTRTEHFFVVTSGPLYGHGLLSLSAMPEGSVHLAGSKGREYVRADGTTGSYPLTGEQRSALITLDQRIRSLLERPPYRILAMIGSGYQRKFGQLTVSRQDIHRSVPADTSQRFLEEVRAVVRELDPAGDSFELDDTGFDIELTLTTEGNRTHGFDKGDGVAFLVESLDLSLHDGRVLVCGDTPSDLPMLEHLAGAGYETDAIFVAPDGDLAQRVRRFASRAAFCSGPDVLVAALGLIGQGGSV